MEFKLNATLGNVRLANGEWKITFCVPVSESIEMAKVACSCQEEPLKITVAIGEQETIGGMA